MQINDYITIGISFCTLLINVLFYIFVAPRITYRLKYKEQLFQLCSEYLDYLVEITSMDDFEGVSRKVRSYSIKIQLLYKEGKAPQELEYFLEKLFQYIKKRKENMTDTEIVEWKNGMRVYIRDLRMLMSKYRNKVIW